MDNLIPGALQVILKEGSYRQLMNPTNCQRPSRDDHWPAGKARSIPMELSEPGGKREIFLHKDLNGFTLHSAQPQESLPRVV